ncbi:GNAT family N-acetyltransferase [Mesorhizobium sp. B2-4-15]|uniref:GNAT family N-acetyltransferase n=1 Tax=Mesorhizobium sp. B2-4-15 TaxID=2589934 RepID=UPI001FEEA04C|nr:GNAT family N-acetyltransferase [Mesorhizobium sp. B2-4-15]
MYVEPSQRRRGIGQALMAKMLHDDQGRGARCSWRRTPERCFIPAWAMSGLERC